MNGINRNLMNNQMTMPMMINNPMMISMMMNNPMMMPMLMNNSMMMTTLMNNPMIINNPMMMNMMMAYFSNMGNNTNIGGNMVNNTITGGNMVNNINMGGNMVNNVNNGGKKGNINIGSYNQNDWNIVFERINFNHLVNIRVSPKETVQHAINLFKSKTKTAEKDNEIKFIFNGHELNHCLRIVDSGLINASKITVISIKDVQGANLILKK